MATVDTVYWLPILGGPVPEAGWPGPKVCSHSAMAYHAVFITWTKWTLAMALAWWRWYKYPHTCKMLQEKCNKNRH